MCGIEKVRDEKIQERDSSQDKESVHGFWALPEDAEEGELKSFHN